MLNLSYFSKRCDQKSWLPQEPYATMLLVCIIDSPHSNRGNDFTHLGIEDNNKEKFMVHHRHNGVPLH